MSFLAQVSFSYMCHWLKNTTCYIIVLLQKKTKFYNIVNTERHPPTVCSCFWRLN